MAVLALFSGIRTFFLKNGHLSDLLLMAGRPLPASTGNAVLGGKALLLFSSVMDGPEQAGTQTSDGWKREVFFSTIVSLEPEPSGCCSPTAAGKGEEMQAVVPVHK